MLYSILLDLIQKSPGNFRYFVKLINNGFIYDVRLNNIYPNIPQIINETLIPRYIQNLNRDLINSTSSLISNAYSKYTYDSTYLSSILITDATSATPVFISYLQTYNFYNVFSKYVFYDFFNIIFGPFIKTLAKNIHSIGTTGSFTELISTLLNIPPTAILSVNQIYQFLYKGNNNVYNNLDQWLNIPNLTQDEITSLFSDYYQEVIAQIQDDY
ncbi:MAG: hypothetical protein QXV17_14110 [Candidatus Micrarchaeaceae archaeon]